MKRTLIALLVLILLGSGPTFAAGNSGHLVVLMYHRFDAGGQISTPMSMFKKQMNYLKSNDYNFVSLDEVIAHLKDGRPFPEKSVLITIDDGYESTYTHAYPYLKKEDIPWVLYVYTEAIEKGYPSSLSWDQIRTMAENGVSIENHTYSHGHPISPTFRQGNWIEREIIGPHKLIEQKTGQAIRTFAIPYGEYDTELVSVLEEKYDVIWGIDPGVVDPSSPSTILPRFGVNKSTGWEEFKKKLNRLPLKIESVSRDAGSRLEPGDTLSITLTRPDRYQNGPVNLFLSELGALDWHWSEDKRTIVTRIDQPLHSDWNRIILTAFDHEYGRYRYFSRGFVTGSP
jgi:peptidoglycan/xylan/chitin deacetylase (PgdA/CDA1 family)